jgi:hypothetical protein
MNTIEQLEARVIYLEQQLRISRDINEIERLQRAYGYYIEHWISDELTDLFADGTDSAIHLIGLGIFQGKDHIRKFFQSNMGKNPEFLHQVMQTSGIITVDPDGKTAKGRWNGFGVLAIPRENGVRQELLGGMYENDYVKQDGIWKILVARHIPTYFAFPGQGFVPPERSAVIDPDEVLKMHVEPDVPDNIKPVYPSSYIHPFHFKHPVTGKETGERQWFPGAGTAT